MEFKLENSRVVPGTLVCLDDTYSWIIFPNGGGGFQASYKRLDFTTMAEIFVSPTEAISGKEMVDIIRNGATPRLPHRFETVEAAIEACEKKAATLASS